jgi:hypothetical protein
MRVELGTIKSTNLPDAFTKGEVLFGGMGQNWRKNFHPREKKDARDVAITSMFRGSPTLELDGKTFRSLLRQPAGVIFSADRKAQNKIHPQAEEIVNALADALGNAGNNQLTNPQTGLGGPRFYLERMEILELNKKKVLAVHGFFHDSEMKPQNYFIGLFVDAKPDQRECIVEELIFEAQTRELYEKYCGGFEKSLTSIEWDWN